MLVLLNHGWPGKIRELEHAVERAVLMARENIVRAGDLGLHPDKESHARLEGMSLEEVECFLIKKALARYEGNVSQAAEALGLSRGALYRRLQKFGENR
jgi:DNA-binding NtrC family response regulator